MSRRQSADFILTMRKESSTFLKLLASKVTVRALAAQSVGPLMGRDGTAGVPERGHLYEEDFQ